MKLFKYTKITNFKQLYIIIMYGLNYLKGFSASYRIKLNYPIVLAEARFNNLMDFAVHWCKWNDTTLEAEIKKAIFNPDEILIKYKIKKEDFFEEKALKNI